MGANHLLVQPLKKAFGGILDAYMPRVPLVEGSAEGCLAGGMTTERILTIMRGRPWICRLVERGKRLDKIAMSVVLEVL